MADSDTLTQYYRDYVGRDPSQQELSTRVAALPGYNLDYQRREIAGSQEAKDRAGMPITQAYQQHLGRDPEPGAVYTRTHGLAGRSLAEQLYDIQNSPEARSPDAASRLVQNFDKTAKAPVDMYNESLEKLGLSDARTRVTSLREQLMNTENLLKNVEGDVSARTQESLVSENQRRKLVAGEQAPIGKMLDELGENFEGAQGDYGMILDEAKAETGYGMEGNAIKRQALMDRLRFAIDSAQTIEEKRRWEAEYARLRDQDFQSKSQFDQELNQRERQFAVETALQRQALSKASASSGSSGGGGGTSRSRSGDSSGSSSSGGNSYAMPTYQRRGSDGGFNFQDNSGRPVSAKTFAQQTGTDFNTLLRQMAASGDAGAEDVLRNGTRSRHYRAVTWG